MFNPPDPQSGQPLDEYFTLEYVKSLNEAVKKALSGGNISGGPGITVTHTGGSITIKSSGRRGGMISIPVPPEEGLWVLVSEEGEIKWKETENC
jgi:hypothetical protein